MKISHVLHGFCLILLSFPSTSHGFSYFENYLMSPYHRVIRSVSIMYYLLSLMYYKFKLILIIDIFLFLYL